MLFLVAIVTTVFVLCVRSVPHSASVFSHKYFRSLSHDASSAEAYELLASRLHENLQQLATCVGKSIDDCILLMHQLLKYIRENEVMPVFAASFKLCQ